MARLARQLADDDAYAMANLRPAETGLPMVVWAVAAHDRARHDVWVKVCRMPGLVPSGFGNTVSVAVRPQPHLEPPGQAMGALTMPISRPCTTGARSTGRRSSTTGTVRSAPPRCTSACAVCDAGGRWRHHDRLRDVRCAAAVSEAAVLSVRVQGHRLSPFARRDFSPMAGKSLVAPKPDGNATDIMPAPVCAKNGVCDRNQGLA
jgi:hypothetical protein